MEASDELSNSLAAYLTFQAGKPVQVVGLTRMSDGWESDVYAFDAPAWCEGGHVLRLYFGENAGPTAVNEHRALGFLAGAGYPVPQVRLVERSTQPLGRAFLIMERVTHPVSLGQVWREATPGVRERAIERFCQLFVQLHTLQWADLPSAELVPRQTISQQLKLWSSYLALYPIASLALGIDWLREASPRVTLQPLGLAHWDFHHENILVDGADRAWVIDWTQFQATDVRFDLAWTLMLLASERDAETAQAVRQGYFALRGWDATVVQPELDFFEAAACIKRLASVMISLGAGADAVGMRPGAEALMSSRMPRFAVVYRRWLELTQTPLPDVEQMLAGH